MAILDSRSGKDTFVNFCQKHKHWCGNFSTVDFVKEIAATCGWDGTKTPVNRKFLSDLKDLLTDWNDVPFKKVKNAIRMYEREAIDYGFDSEEVLCFVHCREPQEIQKFVDELGAKTLLIRRPEIETLEQLNHADLEVFNYSYDFVIYNDGNLKSLSQKAARFLGEMGYKICKNKKSDV